MKNAYGQWRWFHTWEAVYSRTSEGLPEKIVGTAIDITDRKQLEERFSRDWEIQEVGKNQRA
jgi:PAS domain-containing protein